jgi:hypothetical protein
VTTNLLRPLPQIVNIAIDDRKAFTQLWREYFNSVDGVLRTSQTVALAAPTNANAKAAGVPLGGFYTSTADPSPVYIRTV